MNSRLVALAALCREVAIPASVLVWIAAFGSAGIGSTGAAPIINHLAPLLTADATFADKPPPVVSGASGTVSLTTPPASVATDAAVSVATEAAPTVATEAAVEPAPAAPAPEPIVTAALTDLSETLPTEASPERITKINSATREPDRHQSGSRLNRSSRRVFRRRHLHRPLSLGAVPAHPQGRQRQDSRTAKGDRQEKGQTGYGHEDLYDTHQ